MRFVAFLDILGFAAYLERTPLSNALKTIQQALEQLDIACRLDVRGDTTPIITERIPKKHSPLRCFSFSDTFILCSEDDSAESFIQICLGASIITRKLFVMGLPVRGAITCGEAEAVPNSNHFVGKAVVRAAELEKEQDWLGVVIDPDCVTPERLEQFKNAAWYYSFVPYPVPFKTGPRLCYVINWRMNLDIQAGVCSLFTYTNNPEATRKIANTLKFAKYIVIQRLHVFGWVHIETNEKAVIPWARFFVAGDDKTLPYNFDTRDGY